MPITKATASSVAPAAKGDLVVGSATNDAAILGVGTNNYVLTADSAEATGLKWAAAGGGGLTLLSTTTLSGSSTSLTSISQDYINLMIVGNIISTNDCGIRLQYNSDTTSSNYSSYFHNGYGSDTRYLQYDLSAGDIGNTINASGALTKNYSIINIYRYSAAETHQAYASIRQGFPGTGVDYRSFNTHHVHNGTSAISSIQIIVTAGTLSGTIYLYGVK